MSVNMIWDSLSELFLLTTENYQAWLSVSKGYDSTVGGTKTTAEQSMWYIIRRMELRYTELNSATYIFK